MAPCLQETTPQHSPNSILDRHVPDITMSDTADATDAKDEDGIKAAVRDAAKKTQDRLAAYQQKQAAKAAAAALEEAQKKAPSKGKLEADNTVSRLQALVSESKRLTTKSRELNTQAPNVAVAAHDTSATAPAPAKDATATTPPGLHRAQSVGDPVSLRRQAAATSSMDNSMPASSRMTPKGKKLSAIFQNLGPAGGNTGNNHSSMSQSEHNMTSMTGSHHNMERDNSVRSLMPAVESAMTQFSLAQWQHKREQQQQQQHKSAEKDKQQSKPKKGGSQKDFAEDDTNNDGSSDLDVDIDEDESGSDHGNVNSKKKRKPQEKQQPEENGDFSILSMVEKKKKEKEGREEVEEMIEEYYSTPAAAAGAKKQQDNEPGYDISETSPRLKRNMSGSKKKRMPRRPQSKQEKSEAAAGAAVRAPQAEENSDEDMPVLAPFETPKANKPKFGTQAAIAALSQQLKDTQNVEDEYPEMEKSMSQEEAETSMSLSMVFHSSNKKITSSPQETKSSPQQSKSKSKSPQAAALVRTSLRRPSMEPSPPPSSPQAPLNLSKLPLIGDNPNSRVTPEHDNDDDDDDNQSAASSSSMRGSRQRRSTRTGRGRNSGDDSSSQQSMRSKSRSSRSKSRTRVTRRASLKGGVKAKGENVSLSIINKYHKKAEGGSIQSFPDEVSVEDQINSNNDNTTATKAELDTSELSRSSESGGGRDELGLSRSASMEDDSADSAFSNDSSRTNGSRRRGRSSNADNSNRSKQDIGRSRSRSRDVGRRTPSSRSVSRSASSRRGGGRRQRRSSLNGMADGSTREMSASAREPTSRRSRTSKDGSSSLQDMNASARESGSDRRRRSISTRRGAGRRGDRRRRSSDEYEDESEVSTADEILGSLDVSDIKIVGEDDEDDMKNDSSILDDSSRTSIYDRKQKVTGSLAGLPKLQSSGQEGADDCETSVVSESTKSKKSKMGKFARKVGRRLTMQGGKKKKHVGAAGDGDEDGEEEDMTETDLELQALVAEFDEEEKQIEAADGSSEIPEIRENGKTEVVDSPEFQKAKKKRQSTVFGAIKKVGSKIKKKKKKKKKSKDSQVLESDSDSSDNEIQGSEYSGGTMDRSHSDSIGEDDEGVADFAQLQINGDKASIEMCGSDRSEEPIRTPQPKGRQRRGTVAMRRQRADRQRTQQSLQAVLGSKLESARGDEDASVATTDTRVRRAKSVRGRMQRNRTAERGDSPPSGSKVDVKRHKSVKGRLEGDNSSRVEKSRRLRRVKSSDADEGNDETPPPFDWKAYSEDKPAKKGKDKRKSKVDKDGKRMSGGLSKVIYHGQAVTS